MLSIEEKILTLNSLRLLPIAALRFTFYALRFLPVPSYISGFLWQFSVSMLYV